MKRGAIGAALIALVLAGCAPTERDDQLELTYYYLRF